MTKSALAGLLESCNLELRAIPWNQDGYPEISRIFRFGSGRCFWRAPYIAYRRLSSKRAVRPHKPDSPCGGLCSKQYRRGRGRITDKSFAVFFAQARGSLFELQTQIELARDPGFAAPGPGQRNPHRGRGDIVGHDAWTDRDAWSIQLTRDRLVSRLTRLRPLTVAQGLDWARARLLSSRDRCRRPGRSPETTNPVTTEKVDRLAGKERRSGWRGR